MFNTEFIAFDSYAPKRIVTNDDLSKLVDTSDEWISSRTGISQRHISEGENTSELCIHVAEGPVSYTHLTLPTICSV